jgi:hypothetical protein
LENRKQNWFFWVVVGVGISGEREKVEEIVWEGKYSANTVYTCM